MTNKKKLLFLISLGSILEYYDYAILIPVSNDLLNLFFSFLIFAIGAFFRPLGGLIFAHIGDTRGRNKTFVYTVLFMAIPTFAIAFIPSITQIGSWATVLLVMLRIMQGMAMGGEIPGAIVFGYETSSTKYKALNSAVVVTGTNIGFLLASVICMLLVNVNYYFGSWRLAFVLGGLFGIGSYFLRKELTETPAYLQYKSTIAHEEVPLKKLFKYNSKAVWQLVAIGCFLSSILSIFTFYMPVYLSTFYHFPMAKLMEFNSYTIIIFIIGSLTAGIFHKYFGRTFFMFFIPIFSVFAIWLFSAYRYLDLNQIFILHIITLLAVGIVCGRLPVLAASFFPVEVRYTGVALTYNISFGIIAGSTQMLLTWLLESTGLLWIPGVYLLFFAIFAFWAFLRAQREQFIIYQD
jgi:MFS family permease